MSKLLDEKLCKSPLSDMKCRIAVYKLLSCLVYLYKSMNNCYFRNYSKSFTSLQDGSLKKSRVTPLTLFAAKGPPPLVIGPVGATSAALIGPERVERRTQSGSRHFDFVQLCVP